MSEKRKVSVVSIAKRQEEFEPLKKALKEQSYRDFEFVTSTKGTIPEAWNDAVSRAKGDIIVFTETDAFPVNEHWLKDLISEMKDEKTIVRGIEVIPHPWDLCNLAVPKKVFEEIRFDEAFLVAEDTEFFAHLKSLGKYTLKEVKTAPVVHSRNDHPSKRLSRAFMYGRLWTRARLRHGTSGPGSSPRGTTLAGFSTVAVKLAFILENILNLSGMGVGLIEYYLLGRR
ncbi:MAG: glycosyltransferase [Candidatus Altiarchaeota archaeon]